jgi:hypothetical protein
MTEAANGPPVAQKMLIDNLHCIVWADARIPNCFRSRSINDHVGAAPALAEAAAEGDPNRRLRPTMLQACLDFLKRLLCPLLMAGGAGADKEVWACRHSTFPV